MVSTESFTPSWATSQMAYDLRAKYAEIVGNILEEIALSRNSLNFVRWFGLLDDLHTEINQKLTDKEKKIYEEKLNTCIETINKNREEYLGKSKDSIKLYKVKQAIKILEMWLREKMEDHKMFGSKADIENLN